MRPSRLLLAAAASCALAGPLSAQTITTSAGTQYNATAISDDATGSSMTGMWVDVWSGNQFFSTQWTNLGGGNYGIDNSLVRIEVGSTENTYPGLPYFGSWLVTLKTSDDLQRIRFRGASGGTVFDRTTALCIFNEGTPGSSCGSDVDVLFNNVKALYTNQVALNGVVYGDLFETVDIDFSNASFLFNSTLNNRNNSPFTIWMDSDAARNLSTTVPEPSTYALMALGLAGIVAARRRRRA